MLWRRVLALFIIMAVAVASWVLFDRMQTFDVNRRVEFALNYNSVRDFSHYLGYPLDKFLARMKNSGVTTLVVGEKTIDRLVNQGSLGSLPGYPVQATFFSYADLADMQRLGGLVPPGLAPRPDENYLFIRDNPDLADWVTTALENRLGHERVRRLDAGEGLVVIGIEGKKQELATVPLGVFPPDIQWAESQGFLVIASVNNHPGLDAAEVSRELAVLPAGTRVIFNSVQLPGSPRGLGTLAGFFKARGLGLVKVHPAPVPEGLADLASLLEYPVTKAYRPYRGERLTDQIIAVKDRNMRIVLFEPFSGTPDPEADATKLVDNAAALAAGLREQGFVIGPTRPFRPYHPPAWAEAVLGGGTAAAAAYLALAFWPALARRTWILALPAVAAGAAAAAVAPDPARPALALVAAVTFPTLGIMAAARAVTDLTSLRAGGKSQAASRPGGFRQAALAGALSLAVATLVSVAGGLIVTGLLADISYSLEFNLFRGVKLAVALPALVTAVYLLLGPSPVHGPGGYDWGSEESPWQRARRIVATIRELGSNQIRLWHILALAGAAVAAFVLVSRTGNWSSVPVSPLEIKIRGWLEMTLGARPRTKEFLIGQPALFLAGFWLAGMRSGFPGWGKDSLVWPGILAVVGTIAGASLINSFSHIHSPAYLSALRTFHGLWLGGLVGLTLAAAGWIGSKSLARWASGSSSSNKRQVR